MLQLVKKTIGKALIILLLTVWSGSAQSGSTLFILTFQFSNKNLVIKAELTICLSEKQTGKTLIRELLQKQSDLGLPDLGLPCLS